jgi:hypothetical protein
MYFENTGSTTRMSFEEKTGAASPLYGVDLSMYSSAPALADVDGDGMIDMLCGESYGYTLYYKNLGTSSKAAFSIQAGSGNPMGETGFMRHAASMADIDGDGLLDVFTGGLAMKFFKNTGTASIPVLTEQGSHPFTGLALTDMNPTFGDVNGDGIIDAVVGCSTGEVYYWAGGVGGTYVLQSGSDSPFASIDVGFQSAPALVDLDGDGDLDLFLGAGDDSSGPTGNSGNVIYYKNTGSTAVPVFTLMAAENNPLSAVGPPAHPRFSTPVFADLDHDGDFDMLIGNFDGTILYFENTGTKVSALFTERTGGANPFNGVDIGGMSSLAVGDLDNDGDIDVLGSHNQGTTYFQNQAVQKYCLQGGGAYPKQEQGVGSQYVCSCLAGTAGKQCATTLPAGYASQGGYATDMAFLACGAGRYTDSIRSAACTACPVGKFAAGAAAAACLSAPTGKYQPTSLGATAPEGCASGKYTDTEAASACKTCPDGKHQPQTAQIDCIWISEPGYFSSGGLKFPCPTSKYQPASGQPDCFSCPTGKYQGSAAQSDCTDCAACPGGVNRQGCGNSTAGYCIDCAPGNFLRASDKSCLPCPSGEFQDTKNSAACVECPTGKYQLTTGQVSLIAVKSDA